MAWSKRSLRSIDPTWLYRNKHVYSHYWSRCACGRDSDHWIHKGSDLPEYKETKLYKVEWGYQLPVEVEE